MSELTQCNYCNLRQMRAQAKRDGEVLVIKRGAPMVATWSRSTVVYRLPPGMLRGAFHRLPPDEQHDYFAAEYGSVGYRCEC